MKLPRDKRGVYALWLPSGNAPECLYVGISTTCVRRRLLQHLSSQANSELRRHLRMFRDSLRFAAVHTDDDCQTRQLEAGLIADWQPRCNTLLR